MDKENKLKEQQKNKEDYVSHQYDKCKDIIVSSLNKGDYERALAAVSAGSTLLYLWNQKYTDDFLEKAEVEISKRTYSEDFNFLKKASKDTVLFYDNFGLDTRGLALIYLKALVSTGKKLIYVTTSGGEGKQPEIDQVLNSTTNTEKVYFSKNSSYSKKVYELQKIIIKYKPSYAFLYTSPEDSAGITVFTQMDGFVTRYKINLTDHAFWLGVNAFDYCVEFRNYGACISAKERGIGKEKEILLPYYPVIDKEATFQGFPFDSKNKKIIFSGGSLYKTIDEQLTYYHMVEEILNKNKDTVFLYAGSGDDTFLRNLQSKFKGRVYHIAERKDLYQLMQHVTLYLNTYPLLGGLMTQYAAVAGKIPITLTHSDDSKGILINQDNREIEYDDPNVIVNDVTRLLSDEDYLKSREEKLKGSVISEEKFNEEVASLTDHNSTSYKIDFVSIDTRVVKEEYKNRFKKEDFEYSVASLMNRSLAIDYLGNYVKKIIDGGSKRLLRSFFKV